MVGRWNVLLKWSLFEDMLIFAGGICNMYSIYIGGGFKTYLYPYLEPRNPSIGDSWPCELWVCCKAMGCWGNSYGYQKVYSFEAWLLGLWLESCFGYDFSPKESKGYHRCDNWVVLATLESRNMADGFFPGKLGGWWTYHLLRMVVGKLLSFSVGFLAGTNVGFGPRKENWYGFRLKWLKWNRSIQGLISQAFLAGSPKM